MIYSYLCLVIGVDLYLFIFDIWPTLFCIYQIEAVTVAGCLDYFLNLKDDPQSSLRRSQSCTGRGVGRQGVGSFRKEILRLSPLVFVQLSSSSSEACLSSWDLSHPSGKEHIFGIAPGVFAQPPPSRLAASEVSLQRAFAFLPGATPDFV